ncbi:MAG TPA: class I SAM-dependent methyltransferase [Flavobacterium sp.]|jgi:2-polyprenyl-3-methyl-5-hydroxy-6-metoxy-1,4-benzoquinol methylase
MNNLYLSTKDFSVSKEDFELHYDSENDMLSTFPKPEGEGLDKYYASEDYISHTSSKRTLFEKAYHFVRTIAINKKLQLINSLQGKTGNLLDIGSGTGDFLAAAMNKGWKVTGAEPNLKAREAAKGKGVNMFESTTLLPDHSYDIITMWHVLEHVPDPKFQILELKRLLKPNGHIIIAVPNFHSYDAKHYGKYWAAFDVPRHLWHFSRKSIANLFAEQEFEVVNVLPMMFDAYYVSLLSEKYRTGKSNVLRAFLTGTKSNNSGRKTGEYSSHIYVIK